MELRTGTGGQGLVEVIVNIFQISLLVIAFVVAVRNALDTHKREWSVAALFYAVYFMADIYWVLIVYFYHRNPDFYISEIGWYSAFLFIDILIIMIRPKEEQAVRSRLLWIVPVFTFLMFVFFAVYDSDIPGNIVTFLLMTFILYRSARGLLYLKDAGPEENSRRRMLYTIIIISGLCEYCMWTISCFWMGDTFRNPYFWIDMTISVLMVLLIPAIGKAVRE